MNYLKLIKQLEKFFGMKLKNILITGALGLASLGAAIYFIGVPLYQYYSADDAGKCAIDLKNKNDSDAFCDSNNQLKSKAEVAKEEARLAEEARRAALTPKQRCEEDNKSDGDLMVFCKDDGNYDVKSMDELESEFESDRQTFQQENNNCNPNYTPCVSNVAYDLDCPDVGFMVSVIGVDVFRLDRDGDGYGCEPY